MLLSTTRMLLITLAVGATCAPLASAQEVTGQDDFGDGFDASCNPTGGTQIFSSRTLTPNNQGNKGFSGAPGTFGASNFDVYGITDRRILFDVADDSAGSFPPDDFGFAKTPPNDSGNFIAMTDLENDENPSGLVTAVWEFDTSNSDPELRDDYDTHRVCVDMIAYGDFESDDNVLWEGGFSGSTQTLWDFGLSGDQDTADILYSITMEGGMTYERYFTPFFEVDNWDCLVLDGPGVCAATGATVNYHPNDDGGINDDGTAFNGFILEPTLSDPNNVERAYEETNDFGTFNEIERESFRDPLIEQTSLVQLDNTNKKFTAVVRGTGNSFQLTMTAAQNSTKEIIAVDNILLESAVLGDANGDGRVNNLDINAFGQALFDPLAYAAAFPDSDPDFKLDMNGDGTFNNLDINGFSAKLGLTSQSTATASPSPASPRPRARRQTARRPARR